jgi:hypothetical protein
MYKLRYPPTATKIQLVSTDNTNKYKYITYILGNKMVVRETWFRDQDESWDSESIIVHEGTEESSKEYFQHILYLYK